MKTFHQITLIFSAITLLLSCSATNNLSMTVSQPAPVELSPQVQRIGIINRSRPSEANKGFARIDAILTAEGLKLDEKGAAAALQGLADRLRQSGRFEVVAVLDSTPELDKGLKGLPAPLSQDQIVKVCDQYGLDALYSLSFFDTDTNVNLSIAQVLVPNALGVKIPVPGHQLDLVTRIRSGWRLYEPGLPLQDEMVYEDQFLLSAKGINPAEALQTLSYRTEKVMDQAHRTGFYNGGRLEPSRVRVGRQYFVRGSEPFVRGKRLAQTGAWNEAARLWEQELNHPKEKIAGRAAYNMAIINEINGNLDEAIQWAGDAYSIYGNRDALRYLRILQNRQNQQQRLEAQLSR